MKNAEQKNTKITITLPDGATREYAAGVTAMDVATDISPGLAKVVIAARIDGELSDLSLPIQQDAKLELVKKEADEGLEMIRHDCAHVMAEAVQSLFPGTQVTIGPNIENGFFYDFARNEPFSSEDLEAIEKEMSKIIERGDAFVREVWDRDEAIAYFKDKGEMYKAELIEDLPESEEIKIYRQGEWLDLCRGPHMPTTRHVGKAFKLLKVAGAYWRGDSNRAMLTRIYGTAWRDEKELKAYLHQLEEAEKRDHRKLGAEMDLFHFQPEAQGSVFWHPKGFTVYNQMEGYIRRRLNDAGYQEIKTPQLIDNKLWEKSGHWGKYRENMFVVPDEVPQGSDDGSHEGPILSDQAFEKLMALKPMNCPAHVQVFNQGIKSYRDLPLRLAEFGCCHRNEAHGALHGLMRVRQFTQDDAHIFCTEDQITDEAVGFCELLQNVYSDLGFNDVAVALSLRPDVRVGNDALWDKAEDGLRKALVKTGLEFREDPGEGAFYGPKIDYQIRDAIGRTWQCGTLQLDFNLPERLDASYIGQDGEKHRPVMLHRAILGSLERFIGVMIENYAGKLPLWLAPTQVVVATITDKADAYAGDIQAKLEAAGLRVGLDIRNEKINYKVREHSHAKVPYIFVVGAREAEESTVAVRELGGKDQVVKSADAAIADLAESAKPPF